MASATNYSGNASFTLSSAVDNKTVYVWFKDAAGNVSTSASADITYKTDWRLPTKTELVSVIDTSQTQSIVSFLYDTTLSETYWSSTGDDPSVGDMGSASVWVVYFEDGYVYAAGKTSNKYLRCVRGGQ